MSRLPETTRKLETYTQFKDVYIDAYASDMKEVIEAYGDTVQLLKKQTSAQRTIDTSGLKGKRGRLGGRRVDEPVAVPTSDAQYSRPDDPNSIKIPAIVELNPSQERREMFGIKDAGTALFTISTKWLSQNQIVIDSFEDFFWYKGNSYKITSPDPTGNFLDSSGVIIYSAQKV